MLGGTARLSALKTHEVSLARRAITYWEPKKGYCVGRVHILNNAQ